MKNIINYKGYEAIIEYDETQTLLKGKVLNIQDVITFYGSIKTINDEFKFSIDDYLAFCQEMKKKSDKQFHRSH